MAEKRITLAAIAGAHGIGGEVRLKLFAESLESFKQHKIFEAGGQVLTLKSVRQTGKMPVARFAEIVDRNGAEALRGTELTVARTELPLLADGEYYHIDLVGLSCVADGGAEIGHICAIYNFGAGDIFEIEKPNGRKFMVPKHALEIGGKAATVDRNFADEE